jgi:hypothetical protein
MSAVRFRTLHFALTFSAALAFPMLMTEAQAYTPEQQQACSGDAFRLCGPEIPDVDRVTVCMIRNRSQLSPGCRVFFRAPEPEAAPVVTRVTTRKPPSIRPVTTKPRKSKKPRKSVSPS